MTKRRVYRIISFGGVGDAVLTTPVFRALKEREPSCKIIVFCPDGRHLDIYRHNPYIDLLKRASIWTMPIKSVVYLFRPKLIENKYYTNAYGRYSSKVYQKHAAKIIGEMFNINLESEEVQVFFTKEEEINASRILAKYNNPIIMHITPSCTKNKLWSSNSWNELVGSMSNCTFIQLGLANEERIRGAVHFLGKTSIREAMALIKFAKGFVGVDSVFAHVSSAVGVPGVVLFGPSTPIIWGHKNNINLFKSISCSPCIEILYSSECPYNRLCMKMITVEDVRKALQINID